MSDSVSKSLAALRHEYFCGCYSLPYMPLGVIGDVHQESGYGSRQILPADGARLVKNVGRFAELQDSSGTLC